MLRLRRPVFIWVIWVHPLTAVEIQHADTTPSRSSEHCRVEQWVTDVCRPLALSSRATDTVCVCVCVSDSYQMATEDVTSYIPGMLFASFHHSCVQCNCAQPHLMPGKDSCPPNGICGHPWRHRRCLTTVDTPLSSTRSEGPKQLLTFLPLIGTVCPFVTTDTALSVVSHMY